MGPVWNRLLAPVTGAPGRLGSGYSAKKPFANWLIRELGITLPGNAVRMKAPGEFGFGAVVYGS